MYIGITTFKERFESHFKILLNEIKGFSAIIAVNASYKEGLCSKYCKNMLKILSEYDEVSPIFYQQMRGCSKMWNDLIIHSPTDHILICNDDIRILNCKKLIDNCDNFSKNCEFFTINNCWSHFVISKKFAIEIGWFDERFLGFGHEDGDMMWRYLKKFNKTIPTLYDENIINVSSHIRDEGVTSVSGKYSNFNKIFAYENHYINDMKCKYIIDNNGLQSTFSEKRSQQLPNLEQYPYESFFIKNKNQL